MSYRQVIKVIYKRPSTYASSIHLPMRLIEVPSGDLVAIVLGPSLTTKPSYGQTLPFAVVFEPCSRGDSTRPSIAWFCLFPHTLQIQSASLFGLLSGSTTFAWLHIRCLPAPQCQQFQLKLREETSLSSSFQKSLSALEVHVIILATTYPLKFIVGLRVVPIILGFELMLKDKNNTHISSLMGASAHLIAASHC